MTPGSAGHASRARVRAKLGTRAHGILIPRPMKIASVRSHLLSYPFHDPICLPFWGGQRTILKRDAMFIRVETDNGLVGYAPGQGSERAHREITEIVAPFLVDRTLGDPDALRVQFLEGPGADLEVAKTYCCAE